MMKAIICVLFWSASSLAGFLPSKFEASFDDVRGKTKIPVLIKYKYPQHIYYEVKGDAELLYVCNPRKTWKYTPPWIEGEKGELAVGDSGQFCYSRIFDSLAKGLESNKLYKVAKNGKDATLSFSKDAKAQLGLEKIKITFKNSASKVKSLAEAEEMKMFLSNKPEPVKLILKKFDSSPTFKKDQFKFSPPKDTNITEMK